MADDRAEVARTCPAPPPGAGPVRGGGPGIAASGALRPVTANSSSRAWASTMAVVRMPQNSKP